MRTIKFRGKIKGGKWVFGDFVHPNVILEDEDVDIVLGKAYLNNSSLVIQDTVGQFTGLYDKNGKEIYEGDIVQWGDSEHKIKQVVEFGNGAFGYVYDTIGSFVPYAANTNFDFAALGTDKRFEVIGNIHDNSDLIEKGGNQ